MEIEPLKGGLVCMSEREARLCIDKIKVSAGNVRRCLFELDERRGWQALGYGSLRECMVAEFGQSQSYLYYQLAAARIESQLSTIVEIGNIPEGQLRPLGLLDTAEERREVWEEAKALAGEHGITAEWVRKAVERKIAITEGRPERPEVAALPADRYSLILADPPWRYDFSNTSGRAVENHYPTMDISDLCKLPVGGIAADNSILFLWATSPKLPEAFEVMKAWGFDYKTCAIWRKSGMGLGYYFRQDHELLLIGTRGTPGVPPPEARVSSVVDASKSRHSEKPEVFRDLIEAMYPQSKRVELFCRKPREGWTVWGNEVVN
jgi:N6-adenosine-specific RNA methylase IME4